MPPKQAGKSDTLAETAEDLAGLLSALGKPIFLLDATNRFLYANSAAEEFFGASRPLLRERLLDDFLPADSPLLALVRQVRRAGTSVHEVDVAVEGPCLPRHLASVEVAPLSDEPDKLVVAVEERTLARRLEHQLVHRNAGLSMTAMAALLAHEVKNPLAGIRGAAQLLEHSAGEGDRVLTRLICEETDRIVSLLDRMDSFGSDRPIERMPVNIHEVLNHVRRLLESEKAGSIRFVEDYDPSLPPVSGNRDLLVQVLLNLVKNAVEAVAETSDAEVVLTTRYRQGVRRAGSAGGGLIDLPLVIEVRDNGPGIAEGLRARLFDPFVTSKQDGRGLGLPLVAKLVDDHGGIVEFDSEPRRTVFRLMLPKAEQEAR